MRENYNPVDHATSDPMSGFQPFFFFDEDPEEPERPSPRVQKSDREILKNALTNLLYALTNTRGPLCDIIAAATVPAYFETPEDCQLQLEVLAAVLGRTEQKSLADIGRRHGDLVRATISKRAAPLKDDPLVKVLMTLSHVRSTKERPKNSRRATTAHRKQKLCKPKPTPRLSQFLQSLT